MDPLNPSGLSEDYNIIPNDEEFLFWSPEPDFSQYLSFGTEPGQTPPPLPDTPLQHISTSLSPNSDLENSSDLNLDVYLQQNPTFSPMTAPPPVNNTSSEESRARTPRVSHRCNSKDRTTHNLEDAIHVFAANPNTQVTPRKRKAFSPSQKAEVASTRRIGACVQCKKRKEAVSFHILSPK
jgi:hypothetical protein